MKRWIDKVKDEEGSLMVVALLVLVILTLIGMTAAGTTQKEIRIAGNQKDHRIAFHHADSGIYTTPKLISSAFDNGLEPGGSNITYLGSPGTFYREVMGYDLHDSPRDVRFNLSQMDVDVDVNRLGQEILPGGGAEFASGAEGIGVGSAGGVAIVFNIDSLGQGPASCISNLEAVYRKIVGTPGGL